jgi:hypothetical protein
MNTIVTRALAATTAINLVACATLAGPNAGITWWLTAYLCVYPFTHLAVRHWAK